MIREQRERVFKGWVPLLGVPAFFMSAYLLGLVPRLLQAPLCGVKFFIGIDCPGCGLTRAMVALAHGQIHRSIDLHPLGIVIAGWLVYHFVRGCWWVAVGTPPRALLSDGVRYRMLQVFVGALLIQWIFKLSLIFMK